VTIEREAIYKLMGESEELDYQTYLKTASLLSCQKEFDNLVNGDELQFQIIHQVEELWMKLISYTLLDVVDAIKAKRTNKALTLFQRIHATLRLMTTQLDLLETMAPYDYQAIRLELGNGSGQESPGFKILIRFPTPLWNTFVVYYLDGEEKEGIQRIYNTEYRHCDGYMIAEALAEFDELFQKFLFTHIMLIQRSIGLECSSLKGRPIELLKKRVENRLFPALWEIRSSMTEEWGQTYGLVRDSINDL
jgi:tryptophan 2,3-dioxygenase